MAQQWDDPRLVEIERIIRRGAAYLSDALLEYWPTQVTREAPERNATLHLARSFAEKQYEVYAEVRIGDSREWLDLLALDLERGIQVAIEAKQLKGVGDLAGILKDIDRLMDFDTNGKERRRPIHERFGAVVATTWSDDYAAWWASKDADPPTDHERWTKLDDDPRLQGKASIFGSCVLRSFEDWKGKDENFHYLLYGVFQVPGDREAPVVQP